MLCAVLGITSASLAQGVGINGTGASADASAMLDLSSTTKGFLPPRMTAAQRAAIFSPATGLLVYQTDGTVGLWYNAGTPGAPSWQQAAAGTGGAGQWSVSGTNLYYTAGKVAIGTPPSAFGLSVADALNGLRAATGTAGGTVASFGGVGKFEVDAPFIAGGRLELLENGNLGIGMTTPSNPLSFASVLGKKISLYHDVSGGDYGLGVENSRTKLYSGNSGADVAIGYDNVGTFVERFAVKPTGALAVSGNSGAFGEVLRSMGPTAPASWRASTSATYENTYHVSEEGSVVCSGGAVTPIPGLSQGFTATNIMKLIVTYTLGGSAPFCFACGNSEFSMGLSVDGVAGHWWSETVMNTHTHTISATVVILVGPGSHTLAVVGNGVGPDLVVDRGELDFQMMQP